VTAARSAAPSRVRSRARGAKVHLARRTLATLEAVAGEIRATGAAVEAAQVDALDPQGPDRSLTHPATA
jgi:NADP-dependent 3-hydroxy acid dehydrogenase YdfG